MDKKFQAIGKSVTSTGMAMAGVGAAITAPMALLSGLFVEAGSQVTDIAARLNTAVETVSALGYAAELAGGSIEDVEGSLGKMQKAITEAALGGDEFFASIADKDIDGQLSAIADMIGGIKNGTLQSAAAMEIFGKSGRKMLPFLKDGAAGMAKLRAEAERHGGIITSEEADRADRIGDAFSNMKTVITSIGRSVGSALLPDASRFEGYSNLVAGAGATVRNFIADNAEAVRIAGAFGIALTAGGTAVAALGQSFGIAGSTLTALSSALSFVFSPQGLIVAGVGLITVAVTGLAAEGGRLATVFTTAYSVIGSGIQAVLKDLSDGNISGALGNAYQTIKDTGTILLKFLEKIWEQLKFEGKSFGAMLARAIGEGIMDGLKNLPDRVKTLIGTSDEQIDAARAGYALDEKRRVGNAARDLKLNNQRIDAELANLSAGNGLPIDETKYQREVPLAELPDKYESIANSVKLAFNAAGEEMVAAAGVIESGMQRAITEVKGSFGAVADSRSFAFGDKTVKDEQVSVLKQILEQDKETNKLIPQLVARWAE